MKTYIAAGFDPARFWTLTPRLYALEMEGAADRSRNDRALVWWGAMMPHLKKPPTYDQFVDPPKRHERQSPQVLQGMFDAWAAAWRAERIH